MSYIPDYVDRKHGKSRAQYDLPDMEEHLKETYGITVYQEQVMLLSETGRVQQGRCRRTAESDGQKQIAVLNKMKAQFISGATAKNHPLIYSKRSGPTGSICPIRVQQIARYLLCLRGLPDGLPQSPLSERVHGRGTGTMPAASIRSPSSWKSASVWASSAGTRYQRIKAALP